MTLVVPNDIKHIMQEQKGVEEVLMINRGYFYAWDDC